MEQSAGDKEKMASRTRIHNYRCGQSIILPSVADAEPPHHSGVGFNLFVVCRMGVLAEKSFFKEEVQADLQYTCQVSFQSESASLDPRGLSFDKMKFVH
jgi:hypothetical protein